MLTKSLHTVTAATNVAAYLLATRGSYQRNGNGRALASDALSVLGYPMLVPFAGEDIGDPTVAKIVAACAHMLSLDSRAPAALGVAARCRDVGARYGMPGAEREDLERAYGPGVQS